MLEKIKLSLRVLDPDFDDEINSIISAALLELGIGGLDSEKVDIQDALIVQAVTLYCKANFGMANPDSEKYMEAFNSLRTHLSLSEKYRSNLKGVII